MSNLTLKEQLQALSLGSSSTSDNKSQNKMKKPNTQANPAKQKPQWLEQAQYGVELLKAYFPECFKALKEIQPLKVGIKQDLVKRLSTLNDIVMADKACMVSSLAYYVNSPAYHKSVIPGAKRIDLDGADAGLVTEEEATYSAERRKTKQKKSTTTPATQSIGE